MKCVQGEIIQKKISGGKSKGGDFKRNGELFSRGELFRGNYSGLVIFVGIIQW